MGVAFKRALEAHPNPATLREDQRRWIAKRDRICSATRPIEFSCLLGVTKERAATLSQLSSEHDSTLAQSAETSVRPPSPQLPTPQRDLQSRQELQTASPRSAPTPPAITLSAPAQSDVSTSKPAVNTNSNGITAGELQIVIILVILIAICLIALAVITNIRYNKRRQRLVAKYGSVVADGILAGQIWQGMTNEHLIESWGSPTAVETEVRHTKTKETWKYKQTGKNRFSNRVFLENDVVIGWKV
jgi:hypothetical protein